MSYVKPPDVVKQMVDLGQSKALLSTRDTLIKGFMGGAILALAAFFAVTAATETGSLLVGALIFPVGFAMIYLFGFDLVTGVFTLVPLAWMDRRPGITWKALLRNWGLVFVGNFAGALTVAVLAAILVTNGFATPPDDVGQRLSEIGVDRTIGYKENGASGMLTLFVGAVLCNWMVSSGVVAFLTSTSTPGKIMAMWLPIIVFFFLEFEHSVVNMFLFPIALMIGGDFSIGDYFLWNEIPTLAGNIVGGLLFIGLTMYFAHHRAQGSTRPDLIDGSGPATTPEPRPSSHDDGSGAPSGAGERQVAQA